MELSGMIFVALAVAWAAYLLPKALRHHDEVSRSRSVERFSNTMRVLARREPVARGGARLVFQPGRSDNTTEVTVKGATPAAQPIAQPIVQPIVEPTAAQLRARREASRVATGRRRRVFTLLAFANVVVAAVAAAGVIGWIWQAIPAGLMLAWLIACRLMVKSEIAGDAALRGTALVEEVVIEELDAELSCLPDEYAVARNDQGFDEVDDPTAVTSAIEAVNAGLWDPMPVTLPTYVSKAPAVRRTVRTISLGEPGAWTSGRTDEDAALAREAHAAEKAVRDDRDQGEEKRAVNS